MPIQHRLARICWNSRDWIAPTGEAARLERGRGTYVDKYGFGTEEWLFNLAWPVHGWHYGYVQALSEDRSTVEDVIHLHLFTIDPSGARRYVGMIRNCERIENESAKIAFMAYKRNGWLKLMREQVQSIPGAKPDKLDRSSPDDLFNLRFRSTQLVLHCPALTINDPGFGRKYVRYQPIYKAPDWMISSGDIAKGGTAGTPKIPREPKKNRTTKKATQAGPVDLLHNKLQEELAALLAKKYGLSNVEVEANHVNITVNAKSSRYLIELKTTPNPRLAIREALGQLLEYAYYHGHTGVSELVVVAPASIDDETSRYLSTLNSKSSFSISYKSFVSGQNDFELR